MVVHEEKNEIRFLLHAIYLKEGNIYKGSEEIYKPDTKSLFDKGKRLINVTTFKFTSL